MSWFKRKPKPEPWDGTHRLKYVLYEEFFGSGPDDYHCGWVWKCTCGTGSRPMHFGHVYTEPQALLEFINHRDLYDAL